MFVGMVWSMNFVCLALVLLSAGRRCEGFSATSMADLNKGRLKESLSSNSGKLTLSPELVIPDPTDPTALLLLASELEKMSLQLRATAKANSALLQVSSLSSLQTLCNEQETARGNFPGPIPLLYCDVGDNVELSEVAEAGASGVLLSLKGAIDSVDDLSSQLTDEFMDRCTQALDCGLQPIPEIILSNTYLSSDEQTAQSLIDVLIDKCSFWTEDDLPAALLLSASLTAGNDDDDDDDEVGDLSMPLVSKELKKKIPILASIRVVAGANRMGSAVSELKDAGYAGAALRSECVPGYRMNPDLQAVTSFWNAALSDLKSVKSKSFAGFRSKNFMEKSVPMEWLKYQKNVIDSGALGDASGPPEDLNADNGDYAGF